MKSIERFIESAKKEMIDVIDYTKTANVSDRCEFATRSITTSFEQAFGALLYLRIYDRSMTENEYRTIMNDLESAKFKALDIAWNIF